MDSLIRSEIIRFLPGACVLGTGVPRSKVVLDEVVANVPMAQLTLTGCRGQPTEGRSPVSFPSHLRLRRREGGHAE